MGSVSDEDMYFTYNMGIGFCIVLAPEDVEAAHAIARKHQADSYTIGYTVADPEKKVYVKSVNLVGVDDRFVKGS